MLCRAAVGGGDAVIGGVAVAFYTVIWLLFSYARAYLVAAARTTIGVGGRGWVILFRCCFWLLLVVIVFFFAVLGYYF